MRKLILKDLLPDGMTICMNRCVEPVEQERHTHDFLELEYVVSGSGTHQVGDAEFSVKGGDVFFTNFETPHCFLSDPAHPIVLYNCLFTPESISRSGLNFAEFAAVANDMLYKVVFPSEFKDTPYLTVFDDTMALRQLFETMHQEYIEKKEGYNSMLVGCLIQLLVSFMRLYESQNVLCTPLKKVQGRYMAQALRYIEQNYAEQISLRELSRIALLSPSHLCRVFKDLTGATIFEYIQKLRLQRACDLLKSTEKRVADIALEIGYQDVGYLRRVFKKEMNCTPSEYRSKERNKCN